MNFLKYHLPFTIFLCSLLTIHCSLFVASYCKAQQIQGAIIAGCNLSQVDGDEVAGFHKIGLNMGVSAIIPLKKRLDIAIETIFSQEGSYQAPLSSYSLSNNGHDSTGEYRLNLTYVSVPVLVQYKDKGGLTFGAGFSWSRLVGVREKEFVIDPQTSPNGSVVWDNVSLNSATYSHNDWDVLGDIKFKLYKNIQFDARYSYSFIKIRSLYFYYFKQERHQYNNFLSFRLIWIINSKNIDEDLQKK